MSFEKHTVETFAKKHDITRQSAINKLSKLKKQGKAIVSGGGKQKRIYTISNKPIPKENGFYALVNKHSPEKLTPKFTHQVNKNYTIEHAIIDGIKIGDVRTLNATKHLFNQIKNWKRLFDLAKENNIKKEVYDLYSQAKKEMKVKKIPEKYDKHKRSKSTI